jgi:hypothetical protein
MLDGFPLVLTRAAVYKVTSTIVSMVGFHFTMGVGISFGGRATNQAVLILQYKVALHIETVPRYAGYGAVFLDMSPLLTDYALAIRAFLGIVFNCELGTC